MGENLDVPGRLAVRTPMQWTAGEGAGFTSGQPWLAINPGYVRVNREAEEKDASSVLNFVRRVIRMRKVFPALVYGDYVLASHDDSPVYAYNRVYEGATVAVLLNFSSEEQSYGGLLSPPAAGDVLINNYPVVQWTRGGLRLRPWQALVFVCGR